MGLLEEIGNICQNHVLTPTTLPRHTLSLIMSSRVLVDGKEYMSIVKAMGAKAGLKTAHIQQRTARSIQNLSMI